MNTPRCFTRVMILDPKTNKPISPESWKPASSDQVKAVEWVAIENLAYRFTVLLHKKELADDMNWFDSVSLAEGRQPAGRLGTRIEWVTIYNAVHTADLNRVLEIVGGDPIKQKFYWTEELDEDSRSWKKDESGQSYATFAWFFYGTYGGLNACTARFVSYASRLLRAL